jgi:hypothetical protein
VNDDDQGRLDQCLAMLRTGMLSRDEARGAWNEALSLALLDSLRREFPPEPLLEVRALTREEMT